MLRRPGRRRRRGRPDHPARAASRSASGSSSPAGCPTATAGRWRHQLVEVWQANAGGRYIHQRDQHPAPLDPNFTGVGRCLTDADGTYRFITIKPGPYPWRNHRNAWRPAHIHFSLFGTDFTQRLVTQMYFPGDPLFALDPIYQSITDPKARERLVATLRPRRQPARVEHRLPLGHRAHRQPPHAAVEDAVVSHAGPDRRAVLPLRAAVRRWQRTSCRPAIPGAVRLHGPCPRRRRRSGAGRAAGDLAAGPGRPGGARRAGSLRRDGWTFTGWGRAATDHAGRYSFTTLRPGATEPGPAPFFAVTVFARGLTDRLFTRAYLPGDPALLAADPLLAGLDAGPAGHPDRGRGRARPGVRRPAAGRAGDGVPALPGRPPR